MRLNKKVWSLLVSAALLFSVSLVAVINATGDSWGNNASTSWYNTDNTTFYINDASQLAGVAKLVNDGVTDFAGKIIEVQSAQNTINLSAYRWEPIGSEAHPFRGTLIGGAGQTIEIVGLTIEGEYAYAGFVGYSLGATVGGFRLSGDIRVSSPQSVSVGAAVGYMGEGGTLYDTTNAAAPVRATSGGDVWAGGLIGQGSGLVSNVANHAAVEINGSATGVVGGIVAAPRGVQGVTLKKAENTGAIVLNDSAGGAYAGGIVGVVDGTRLAMADDQTPISNSGTITVGNNGNTYAGGIVGRVTATAQASFSESTGNEGSLTVSAAQGAASAVGGLAGAIEQNASLAIHFVNGGTIVNESGAAAYTGSLIGLVDGNLLWQNGFIGNHDIRVTGGSDVYTGGLVGKVSGTATFGSDTKNTATIQVTAAGDRVYTGGLVGYAGVRLQLDGTSAGAYSNSGSLTVTGGSDVYTGGIIANQAYVKAAGNVASMGAITVTGTQRLYTGGYVGAVTGIDAALSGEAYSGVITVTAAAAGADSQVYTGGIAGYSAAGVTIEQALFHGQIAVSGGTGAYSGGVIGYAGQDAVIAGAAVGRSGGPTPVSIASTGRVGGVAGYVNGTVTGATVKDAAVQAQGADGYAGGIAARAAGEIAASVIGTADGTGYDRAAIVVAAERVAAGGAVGANDGPLLLRAVAAEHLRLTGENGSAGAKLGGIIGAASPSATIGAAGEAVSVSAVSLLTRGADSRAGGVAGVNEAPMQQDRLAVVSDVQIETIGAASYAGGIAGDNRAVLTGLKLDGVQIAAGGDGSALGGIAGYSAGTIGQPAVYASEGYAVQLTVQGVGSAAGGIAGIAEGGAVTGNGTDANATGIRIDTAAAAVGAAVGGIAGRANGTTIAGVVADRPALTVRGTDSDVGLVAGHLLNAEVSQFRVGAAVPDYAVVSMLGANGRAGGVAGRAEQSAIVGSAPAFNVERLTLSVAPAASDSYAGGVVGSGSAARIEQVFARHVNMAIRGSGAASGGIAGYNKGTETAVITGSFVDELNLTVYDTADGSVVGGLIGVNDARDGQADAAPAGTAVSSVQSSRIVGQIVVHAQETATGGLVGDNRTVLANSSLADSVPVLSEGDRSVVGGLAGKNAGNIYYTYSNAVLTVGGQSVIAGGLVGENTGTVIGSYTETDLLAESSGVSERYSLLGGLIGRNSGSVSRSFTSAEVTASGAYVHAGGLLGEQAGAGTVRDSYAAKPVKADGVGSYAGGLIGRLTTGTVTSSYSAGHVSAAGGASAGGFVGYYDNADKGLISGAYYVKDEARSINVGLLDFGGGTYYELNLYERLSPILSGALADRASFPALSGWTFGDGNGGGDTAWRYGSVNAAYKYPELNLRANSGGGNSGGGTGGTDVSMNIAWYTQDRSAYRFVIRTEAELAGLAGLVNGTVTGEPRFDFADRLVELTAPIHIQSTQWAPIGKAEATPFQGTFIGNRHLISGLKVSAAAGAGADVAGLFGVIGERAAVSEVTLEPVSVAGTGRVGSLAGLNRGVVSDIRLTLAEGAVIGGGTMVGGLIGQNSGSLSGLILTVQDGSRIASSADDALVGGLIGDNTAALSYGSASIVDGSVSATGARAIVGGLVARQAGDMLESAIRLSAAGLVSAPGADAIAGGLVGRYVTGTADGVKATFAGGAVLAPGAGSVAGGAVGQSDAGQQIRDAAVEGEAPSGSSDEAEVVVHVTGGSAAGGLIGRKTGTGTAVFEADGLTVRGVAAGVGDGGAAGGIVGKLERAAIARARFEGALSVSANGVKIGGIAGHSIDSVLYKTDVVPVIAVRTVSGENVIGGVVGLTEAADVDAALDFGFYIPLYKGVYEANVRPERFDVTASGLTADIHAGAIAGKVQSASIYNSASSADLRVTGGRSVAIGGIAGTTSGGYIVNARADGGIEADGSSVYHAGGAVGKATGGKLAYVTAGSGRIFVGEAVRQAGVSSAAHVGGFVGMADAADISNAQSAMSIEVVCANPHNTIYAGGFAGLLGDSAAGTIRLAAAEGSLDVSGYAGAYAGGFAGMINRYAVQEAYASGSVANTAFDARGGGFAAVINKDGAVEDAYARGESVVVVGAHSATRSYAGGFVGHNNGKLKRVYESVGTVQALANGSNSYMGSLIGYNFQDGRVTDSYYTGGLPPIRQDGAGGQTAAKADFADRVQLAGWDFTGNASRWSYVRDVHDNEPVLTRVMNWSFAPDLSFVSSQTKGDPAFEVRTAAQLAGIALLYNDLDAFKLFDRAATAAPTVGQIRLGADIALAGKLWTPIGTFTGELEGAGHTISGLEYAADAYDRYGFVSENRGTIARVKFADAYVIGGGYTGIAAGINRPEGKIIEVQVLRAQVQGASAYTGGVAGSNEGEMAAVGIEAVEVSGTTYVGGVTGSSLTDLAELAAAGDSTVTGTGDYVGGIVGDTAGSVSVATAGSLRVSTPGSYVAGIAGRATGIAATISVQANAAGGTADIAASGNRHVGGVAGYTDIAVTAFAAGDVTIAAAGDYAGGVAGETTKAISAVETGDIAVTGKQYAGGVAGSSTAAITGVSTGRIEVVGAGWTGGVAGAIAGDITAFAADGTLAVKGTGDYIGGVAGDTSGSIAVDLAGDINVKSVAGTDNYVGGIAGRATGADSAITVNEAGNLEVSGAAHVGGVAGYAASRIAAASVGDMVIAAAGDYAGGIAGETTKAISNVTAGRIKVDGKQAAGGVAGKTAAAIDTVSVGRVEVTGERQLGGIAGESAGALTGITITGEASVTGTGDLIGGVAGEAAGRTAGVAAHSFSVAGDGMIGGIAGRSAAELADIAISGVTRITGSGDYVGGAVGVTTGSVTVTQAGPITVSSPLGSYIGGIAGHGTGAVISIASGGTVEVTALDYAGGIAGYTDSRIEGVRLGDIRVTAAGDLAGGIAGETTQPIADAAIGRVVVTGNQLLGGIVGRGVSVDEVSLAGAHVTGGGSLGGIAGIVSGRLTGIAATGPIEVAATGDDAGGMAAAAAGVSGADLQDVTVSGVDRAAGIVAKPGGAVANVKAGHITVRGHNDVGGVAADIIAEVSDIRLQSITARGSEYVGGIAGTASADIGDIEIAESATIEASGNYAGGIAGQSSADITGITIGTADVTGRQYVGGIAGKAGRLAEVKLQSVQVTAVELAGGIAGEAAEIQQAELGSVSVAGDNRIGGIAGEAAGAVAGISITGSADVVGTGNQVGGIVGAAAGDIEVVAAKKLNVSSPIGSGVGGIAGQASGGAIAVLEAETIAVVGGEYAGGIAGRSSADIRSATLGRVTVHAAGNYAGGAVGDNEGRIEAVSVRSLELSGGSMVGGIAGDNRGAIESVSVKGNIAGSDHMIGGIAGRNAGSITSSFTQAAVTASGTAPEIAAGGIAGVNAEAGSITLSFSYASVRASADKAVAGGLAGENRGAIENSYYTGAAEANGEDTAVAGGIAGYAAGGSIRHAVSGGQAVASVQGKLVPGRTYAGGIAGQLDGSAELIGNYFDIQMLQFQTAYYDEDGNRVKQAAGAASGLRTAELTSGVLPEGLDTSVWTAAAGFYPKLAYAAASSEGIVSAAAVMLGGDDTTFRVTEAYSLSARSSLTWSDAPGADGSTVLTAQQQIESRSIAINRKPPRYEETAAKPSSPTAQQFQNNAEIVLNTTEAGGTIHYTLDGKTPTEHSPVYVNPIAISDTTVVKAITAVPGKNDSGVYEATFKKAQLSGGGGGGGIIVVPKPEAGEAVEVLINGQAEAAGTESSSEQGGLTVTTVRVDDSVIGKLLEQQTGQVEVFIPFRTQADVFIGEIGAKLVKAMADRGAVLKVGTANGIYTLPASRLDVQAIADRLGAQADLQDIRIRLEIRRGDSTAASQLERAAAAGGFTAASAPVSFRASYAYGDTFGTIGSFESYAQMWIALDDAASGRRVTTAVALEADGTVSHAPTKIVQAGGKTYAVVSSLASSRVYALIRHDAEFADVMAHWARATVGEMGSRLIVSGAGSGLFDPDRDMTRAEFAAIVVKAMGIPGEAGRLPFTDVGAADWHEPYVRAAYQYGLISGYDDGRFGVGDKLTREQAMTIVARAMKLAGLTVTLSAHESRELLDGFTDAASVSQYAEAGIAEALRAGLVTGRDGGELAPGAYITRAEVASIVQRLLSKSGLI